MANNELVLVGTSTKYDRILKSFGVDKITKKDYNEGLAIYTANFYDFVEWVEEVELEDLAGLEFAEKLRRQFSINHDLLETKPDEYYENLEIYSAHLEVSLYRNLRDSGKIKEFEEHGYPNRIS